MDIFIITGASKGIGESLAKGLINENNVLFCISRSRNEDLIAKAKESNCNLKFIKADLSDIAGLSDIMNRIFKEIEIDNADKICLINNAGILDPMKPLEKCEPEEIAGSFNVNLLAPAILCAEFIRRTEGLRADRRIINISSGAGKRAIRGWGCYGASKAGIDLLTQVIALEQENKADPVKIISFAPGVVDTGMQKEIRSALKEDFPDVERFIDLKKKGELLEPEYVASKIKELIYDKNFKQGGVVRIDE